VKVVQLRKFARKLLHWGNVGEDESAIRLGPACAQLFWQKRWKWPELGHEQKIAGGLLGGPSLSIGLPWRALGRLFSIETRFSSYRYLSTDLQSERVVLNELVDPQNRGQSLEAGFYFTMSLAGIL
jgi:hypothetical protein